MTRCHRFSCTSLLLFALLIAIPQLTSAASLPVTASYEHDNLHHSPSSSSSSSSTSSVAHDIQIQSLALAGMAPKVRLGATRTHRRGGDESHTQVASLPIASQKSASSPDVSAAWMLASLLMDSIDHPRKQVDERDITGQSIIGSDGGREEEEEKVEQSSQARAAGEQGYEEDGREEESMESLRGEVVMAARELADYTTSSDQEMQQDGEERHENSNVTEESMEQQEREDKAEEEKEGLIEKELDSKVESSSRSSINRATTDKLQRETRGFFQNIDLGLQDNEILPPLKGYKAYNQQLAQATKKLKWQEEKTKEQAPTTYDRNFMDDFDLKQGADREEEDEELLALENEEAQARAEKEELQRQQAEAEAAREEEQRLADIASDMLLEYMDRKQQQTAFMKQRQKASILGDMVEDKRSNEVLSDDDNADGDLDLQTIDRLIEISSKLHLPADDVVEIISDVEEKKRKKDTSPLVSVPRFRPLVAPPRPQGPIYKYTHAPVPPPPKISKPPKPINPYKKWYKQRGKSKQFKQDYWFKPAKQFLAYPSYLYYQKPYRAYYPVYFPPPKPRLYSKPEFAYDYNFEDSLDYGLKPSKRRNMNRQKGKGQSWKFMALGPPAAPYISNYILPHPRTYYSLPMPKPAPPPTSQRRPAASSYYYPPDYDNDALGEQQENDEELENFIEKMYFHRRIF